MIADRLLGTGEGGSRANKRRGNSATFQGLGARPHIGTNSTQDLKQVCPTGWGGRGAFFQQGPRRLLLGPWWEVSKGFPPILGEATGLRATRGGPSQGDIRR